MIVTKRKIVTAIVDILLIIVVVAGAYFLSNYLFGTIPIGGPSMETTVHDGDTVLYFKRGTYKRGDIVVFNTHQLNEAGAERLYIKRIIAFPGETVEIKLLEDGQYYIFVNDVKLSEDYLPEGVPNARERDYLFRGAERFTVPEGCFYFCGDNRNNSSDSRTSDMMGRLDSILGRVIMRYKRDGVLLKDVQIIKRP